MLSFLISKRITTCFGTAVRVHQPAQVDAVFKAYFSERLVLPPAQYESYLKDVCKHKFKEEDHRWQSLTQNIEDNIHIYNARSQISMLKLLVNIKSKVQLVQTLMTELSTKINALNLDQIAMYLWCVCKLNGKNRFDLLISIFKRINQLLQVNQQRELSPIILKQPNKGEREIEVDLIRIWPSSLSILINSMGHLGIVDKPLLKRLIQDGVRPNLKVFDVDSLVVFLVAFQRLQLRNKRDTFLVYKELRSRGIEIEKVSNETLFNLLCQVTNLSKRKPPVLEEGGDLDKFNQEKEEREKEIQDLRQFYLWVAETYLLKQPKQSLSHVSQIVMNFSKLSVFDQQIWRKCYDIIAKHIKEAKVIDLMMSLSALTSLTKEKRILFEKEEDNISRRLWELSSSIDIEMVKNKKVKPPREIAKKINQFVMEQQRKALEGRKKKEQQINSKPNS